MPSNSFFKLLAIKEKRAAILSSCPFYVITDVLLNSQSAFTFGSRIQLAVCNRMMCRRSER
jgi:hypothetical protein